MPLSAAMGRSLGSSSTMEETAALRALLSSMSNQLILMVGDSSLRNQFMQLARVGLDFNRELPVAYSVVHGNHTGRFLTPFATLLEEKPDSSNGYWGQFPWLLASTRANLTLLYAKVWGCSSIAPVVQKMALVLHNERRVHPELAAWPPAVALWNFGLHLLHIYPARPVRTSALRCALEYERLVRQSLHELRVRLPRTRLVWRTTNAVCESSFEGAWALAVRAYHCAEGDGFHNRSCSLPKIARIRKLCLWRYNISDSLCRDTFMDRRNTAAQRESALAVLRSAQPRVETLDAFGMTDAQCSSTADGRHYPPLLARINLAWLRMLNRPISVS
ncbi:hypothetical protein AB1Y20_002463 [Prymnesium parvum]|uniref:Uncharacterized protein n=1 Tax=Prymnesium parvum TaxID=97485 RepID=A0AB34J917_PRYPA